VVALRGGLYLVVEWRCIVVGLGEHGRARGVWCLCKVFTGYLVCFALNDFDGERIPFLL
jgi:hypothetical protein